MPKINVAIKKQYTITLFCLPGVHKWFYDYITGVIKNMRGTGEVEVKIIK